MRLLVSRVARDRAPSRAPFFSRRRSRDRLGAHAIQAVLGDAAGHAPPDEIVDGLSVCDAAAYARGGDLDGGRRRELHDAPARASPPAPSPGWMAASASSAAGARSCLPGCARLGAPSGVRVRGYARGHRQPCKLEQLRGFAPGAESTGRVGSHDERQLGVRDAWHVWDLQGIHRIGQPAALDLDGAHGQRGRSPCTARAAHAQAVLGTGIGGVPRPPYVGLVR